MGWSVVGMVAGTLGPAAVVGIEQSIEDSVRHGAEVHRNLNGQTVNLDSRKGSYIAGTIVYSLAKNAIIAAAPMALDYASDLASRAVGVNPTENANVKQLCKLGITALAIVGGRYAAKVCRVPLSTATFVKVLCFDALMAGKNYLHGSDHLDIRI